MPPQTSEYNEQEHLEELPFRHRPKTIQCVTKNNMWHDQMFQKNSFKKQLDQFLQNVPDQPLLPAYLPYRMADSNSIVEMVKHRTPRAEWAENLLKHIKGNQRTTHDDRTQEHSAPFSISLANSQAAEVT